MRFARLIAAFLVIGGLTVATAPAPAVAAIVVDVNKGVLQPLPIAIPTFSGASPYGPGIAKVITDNLERSGLFAPISPDKFIEKSIDIGVYPNIPLWKQINAEALINGKVTIGSDGRLKVDYHVYDIYAGTDILRKTYFSTPDNWRRVAHKISDDVYKTLTGETGYFDTRVVFVSESGPKSKRLRRLAIMDQDGANPSFLTEGAEQIFTPRFSATSQQITYMALRDNGAVVYLFDLETGRRESLGKYSGIVFAPRFSPDGTKVAFSVSEGGNTDIYVMDLRSRTTKRVTSDPSIDTSPAFSPDGSRIVFNSDRGGSPQIYVMNADGSGQRRISFGEGRYTTPVWSPRGDLIAFTKQTGSSFHIGVMKPDGSEEHLLTTSYLDEGPTWAPNGRVLMFFREGHGGGPHLWTVDVTGRVEKPEPYPGPASDPAWSPLLN